MILLLLNSIEINYRTFHYEGTQQVKMIRILLTKPNPKLGSIDGHMLYGIQGVYLKSHRLRPNVEQCVVAAGSDDARDKWFLVEVTEFNPCRNPSLDKPPPMLETAAMEESTDLPEPGLPSEEVIAKMM